MADIASISAAWTSMKAASEIARVLFDAKVDSAAKDQILTMRGLIASSLDAVIVAKEEVQAARDAERAATDKLVAYEEWLEERKRYKLFSPSDGTILYALKKEESNGDLAHYICTNCYKDSKKSILQGLVIDGAFAWECPDCHTKFRTNHRGRAAAIFPSA